MKHVHREMKDVRKLELGQKETLNKWEQLLYPKASRIPSEITLISNIEELYIALILEWEKICVPCMCMI